MATMADRVTGMVSVVIPCFNGRRYVREAVKSVLEQTYGLIEVIVVDDGSGDGSLDVLEPMAADPRIRLFRHEINRGIPAARNTGIRESRGEYIAFLDQDDIWFSDIIEKQLRVFKKESSDKIGLVFSNILITHGEPWVGEKPPHDFVPRGVNAMPIHEVQRKLFLVDFIPIITAMLPRRVLDDIGLLDEKITGGSDDHDLFLRIAGNYKLFFLEEALATRREHGENYSDLSKMKDDQLYIAEKMVGMFPWLADLRRKKRGNVYESLGYQYCTKGEYSQAIGCYVEAIKANPVDITLWLRAPGAVLGYLFGPRLHKAYFNMGRRAREMLARLG